MRRALDAGRTGARDRGVDRAALAHPVPQSLSYLIDDLARRHGALRTGTASSYLRCEDEALLARVLVRPQPSPRCSCAGSRPRWSSRPRRWRDVLDVLREAGYAPAAESPGR